MSIGKLEDNQRTQFQDTLLRVKIPNVDGFVAAWTDLSNPETVKAEIACAFKEIDDHTPEQMDALKGWFTILMDTIDKQDSTTRSKLLSTCGQACASGATLVFKKIWVESKDLKYFLQKIDEQLCEGDDFYRYVDENTIEIAYPRCPCSGSSVSLLLGVLEHALL